MCLIGYSAGSRNNKQFYWAKNLSSKKFTQEKIHKLDFESSSVFALFWNMAKTHFPDAIIKDTTDFFTSIGACGMDADSGAKATKGIYGLEVDGLNIEFHGVDLAPPMGVFASNYAKWVCLQYGKNKLIVYFPDLSTTNTSPTTMLSLGRQAGGLIKDTVAIFTSPNMGFAFRVQPTLPFAGGLRMIMGPVCRWCRLWIHRLTLSRQVCLSSQASILNGYGRNIWKLRL